MTSGDITLRRHVALRSQLIARRVSLATVLAVAFSVLPAAGQFAGPLSTMDEMLLLVYPEQLLDGRIPHLDFFTVYGPGGLGLLAAIYSLTGPTVIAERAVGLVYHVAIATGVVRLTGRFGRIASCASGVTSALILLPLGPPAYAWLGGLALTVWSLALVTESSGPRRAAMAGILGGLVAAWRIEMLVLLLAVGPLLWRTRHAKPYIAGFVIGVAPTGAFLALAGQQVLDNVFLGRMAVNARLDLHMVPPLVWIGVALSVVTTGALAVLAFRSHRERRVTGAHAAIAALLLPQGMQRIDFVHVGFVMCVIAPLGVAHLLRNLDSLENKRVWRGLIVTAEMSLMLLSLSAMVSLRQSDVGDLAHEGRTTRVSSADRPRLEAELRLINHIVPVGSKVFIGARDMSVPTLNNIQLYHLLPEYRADSYYLELPPGVAEKRGSPLLHDVLGADALVLSDVPTSLRKALFPRIGKGDDGVNRAVASHFCPAGSLPHLTVYLRCEGR